MSEVELAARRAKGQQPSLPDDNDDDDDDDEVSPGKATLAARLKEKIMHSLPTFASIDSGDLDRLGWAFRLSVLHLLLYVTMLIYFVASGTISEMNKKFLALDAPKKADATCDVVPVAVTGTYFADRNGFWSSHSEYDKASAIYQLDLTASVVTPEQYRAVMHNFASQVQAIGVRQAGYDVVSSLLAWGAFRAVSDTTANMRFRPFSQMAQTFQDVSSLSVVGVPMLASKEGVCDTSNFGSFTYAASTMHFFTPFPLQGKPSAAPTLQPTMLHAPSLPPAPTTPTLPPDRTAQPSSSIDTFSYDPCPDQISIGNNTLNIQSSTTHSFGFDLSSALLVFALNMGVIDDSALTLVFNRTGSKDSLTIHIEGYISENFPEMDPFFCFRTVGQPRACFVSDSSYTSRLYPVVTSSVFLEGDEIRSCSCPQDALNLGCNSAGTLQLTMLFSRAGNIGTSGSLDIIKVGWKLQQMIADDPLTGAGKIRAFVAGLGYAATFINYHLTSDEQLKWKNGEFEKAHLPKYKDFAADFASLGPAISIISYPLFYQSTNAFINTAGIKLVSFSTHSINGTSGEKILQDTCQDTLYQPAVLAAMAATPPVALLQPYLSCHATARSAFVSAAGIAAGNAALISTLFLTLALTLLIQYTNTYNKARKVVPPARKAVLERRANKADKEEMRALIAQLQLQLQQQQVQWQQESWQLRQEMRILAPSQQPQHAQQYPSSHQPKQQPPHPASPHPPSPDQSAFHAPPHMQLIGNQISTASTAPIAPIAPHRRPSQQRPSINLEAGEGIEDNPMHSIERSSRDSRDSRGSVGFGRASVSFRRSGSHSDL